MITFLLLLTIVFLLLVLFSNKIKRLLRHWNLDFGNWCNRMRNAWIDRRLVQFNNKAVAIHQKKLKLQELKNGKNPLQLKDLTPRDDIDAEGHYAKLLRWALSKRDIKNMALSGPYGSGKSSILKTFQKRNKNHRFLNISLASFKDHIIKGELETDVILLSILQQIFYYVKAKKVPDSSFKRVRKFSKTHAVLKSMGLAMYVICLIHILIPKWHLNLRPLTAWNYQHAEFISLFCYGFVLFGSILLLYIIFRTYSHSRLNKLKISSAELEVVSTKETSVLNQHLDEILYFFEIARYDVVIFEDIDRFDKKHNTEIFIKLRELNTLINNARHRGRHVCFIYAIKDDIFVDEERTKFFDLIIPVIPVINTANSADQLSMLLKGLKLKKPISKGFVNDIGIFIDDMRLLLNIINEFIIFQDNIGDFDPEPDNLLGMVIYKNVFPAAFAELYSNKGKVYNLFAEKEQLIRPMLTNLINEEEQLIKDIETTEKELATSIKELRAIYIQEMFDTLPEATGRVTMGYDSYNGVALKENITFGKLRNQTNIQYDTKGSYNITSQYSNIAFKTIENQVDPTRSYAERERFLTYKTNGQLEEKKSRLQELRTDRAMLNSSSIKSLCTLKSLTLIDERLKDNDLLVYLLSNGYIDEQYRNYMNYFYPESISKQDREFVMAVIYQRPKLYNTKIDQIAEVIQQIKTEDFDKIQLLNLDIMTYLLKHPQEHLQKRNILMQQVANNKPASQNFLLKYLEEGRHPELLLKELAGYWPRLWEYLQVESKLPSDTLRKYLKFVLYHCSLEDLSSLDQNQMLSNYISAMTDFGVFTADAKNTAIIQNILTALNIKFQQLTAQDDNNPYRDFIYRQQHYQLTPANIEQIFHFYAPSTSAKVIATKNYTTILGSELKHLVDYVDEKIGLYTTNVLLVLPNNSQESEESFVDLLNKVADQDMIKAIIDKIKTPICNISKIENQETWQLLLQADRLAVTWYNITQYWNAFKLDERLVRYLNENSHCTELQTQELGDDTDLEQDKQLEFYKSLMENSSLSYDAFAAMIDSMGELRPEFDFKKIAREKTEILIRKDKVALTDDYYQQLEKIGGLHIRLLEHHREEFIQDVASYEFNTADYEMLYQSNIFSDNEKLLIEENMPIEEIENSTVIADTLGRLYASVNKTLSKDELESLLANMSIQHEKLLLVLQAFERSEPNSWPTLLNLLGAPYNDIVPSKKPTMLPKSDLNWRLAGQLDKKIISSVTEKDDQIKLNKYQK